MRIGSLMQCAFLGGLSLTAVRCEEGELSEKCKVICQSFQCDDRVVPNCKEDCIGRMADAETIGDACAKNYDVMLDCLAEVECGIISDWEELRGRPNDDYPCKLETNSFLEQCPDLWFDAQVKK